MEEPFALKTLSYWSFLKSGSIYNCPSRIKKTVCSDIHFLKQLHGTYQIMPNASSILLATKFTTFTIKHISGIRFECTALGNLIHARSVDNSDIFTLGINTFSSQIFEGEIEQSTMYNKEMIHRDASCLYVMTNDFRYDWLSDRCEEDKIIEKVSLTIEQQKEKILHINMKKMQIYFNEEAATDHEEAKYIKVE